MSYDTPPPAPTSGKYNVLAIVSLVTAFVVSLAAIITGHIALSQIKRTGEKGRGLAIAGLVLGYLGILAGIIGIIALIVFAVTRSSEIVNSPDFGSRSGSGSQSTVEPFPSASSAPDASGSAETAASCDTLLAAVSDAASELQDNFSELQSDPAAAVVALQKLSGDFDTGLSEISDPAVLAAGEKANGSLKTMIADIQALQADPTGNSSAILTDAQAVQDDFAAIDTLCN
ncbi:DUF4190 domain-containing protein [Subtercola boreus]|nr:DUF4190 domain-containing protein [Subtercola boreus]